MGGRVGWVCASYRVECVCGWVGYLLSTGWMGGFAKVDNGVGFDTYKGEV